MNFENLKSELSEAKDFTEIIKIFEKANGNFEDMPIIEFAPVIHAHWEEYKDSSQERVYGHAYIGNKCSNCGEDPFRKDGIRVLTPRCPYCGAIMEEKKCLNITD